MSYFHVSQFSEPFKIHYLIFDYVGNSIPLVCVHGIIRNCRDFDYLAISLSKHCKVICPDIIGRGKSSWIKNLTLYNYSTYCKSIIYLLQHLKINKINFLGTSMGGIIGMYLAAYFPKLINSLILNDIGPFIDIVPLKKIAEYISNIPKFNNVSSAKHYLQKMLYNFKITQKEHWDHIVKYSIIKQQNDYIIAADPKISIAFNDTIKSIHNMNMWDVWKKIKSKTLVLRGSQSDILTRDTLKKMIELNPITDYIEYPNIGHNPSLMENYQIKDIQDWLIVNSLL
ncbi:alpha/beta hydrolase [Neoehrlichia mikurensis]|uniref:Alpha/beta hydrolase n=1 Tax=Neoehrlichia mikurensis TaxID=89586 RepID=A0A9Q9BVT6_9RICK|nr:alpha/beta hydrolase [Neoehrlichia mikurensis]QXK91676.1 alpha/beta hydrolase [Neoehrlichia mikurensis]QXK92887.1 alpha/beta hydrolase [Neoehrlichia mikurensis]QXK93367.1 alpha/beta hydrolase [Neoehrlichia mikurensis]UTO55688.1 alpha/beta hydrolase [Neoehrlichia mikurensis]UTO56606.1 alpha/beta hydrolase [Neoehrlichia mikurensis]